MTGRERVLKVFNREKADELPVYEHFWDNALSRWEETNQIPRGIEMDALGEYFDLDMITVIPCNYKIDFRFKNEVLEENDRWKIEKDGNYAILKRFNILDSTPEHISFSIKEREDFDKVKHMLFAEEGRINFPLYKKMRDRAVKKDKFFCYATPGVFECMHPVMGHENLLIAMAVDPDFVKEMSDLYANLIIGCMEIAFKKEGYPDAVWMYEDLGFKDHPFIGESMYREILFPAHKKIVDYVHSIHKKIIMHSCGNIMTLLPSIVLTGIDCLQAMEVKAGMDLVKIAKTYGDRIALMGGLDVRALEKGTKEAIDLELESKLPTVFEYAPYILHTDHSIPPTVDVENYRYFIQKAKSLYKAVK